MLLSSRNDLKRVTIEYADGTTDVFDIGDSSGFIREGYTYRQDIEGSDKVTAILNTFEIYWAEKRNGSAFDFRPSQTSRGVP